jgi:predicted Zn finger-like uncharacterized protein
MLTECPSCQTRYEVEDRLLRRRGRRIRCSICDESWFLLPADSHKPIDIPVLRITAPLASATGAAVPIVVAPRSPIVPSVTSPFVASRVGPRKPAVRFRPRVPAAAIRIGVLAAGATMLMLAIGQRERIVRHLPQMGAAYAALGLPVNLRGLEFRDIKSTILTDNGQRMLAVEGVIAQVGGRDAKVPDVRVAVRDPSGRELYSWTSPAPKSQLNRGETTLFRARLAAPPMSGADIKIQFADAVTR